MTAPLAGRTAIVTGAARGIGLGIAQRLARDGAAVAIWDRDLSPFDPKAAGFEPAALVEVDVAELASVERAHAQTIACSGRIDILINTAGINGPVAPTWEYPPDTWHKVLAVNLTGVFHCCRVVIPTMKAASYGRIVNISSAAGKEGVPGIAAYAAAKAGVIGYTKSIARELVGSGVLVNSLAPVITETELFREMTAEHIASSKAKIPMGRFLTVPEIAAMVAWIAGPECTFCTGFTFDLSGGRATY
ncbi:MAG: SDR family oxidoreductase [Burkholderiales bacterium]|nr:SDR family oxidoreductase [Burkholderiales bacterium]